MKTNEERERDHRSGNTGQNSNNKNEQPTNNRPAAGERGNEDESGRRAQKTAGKHEDNTQAKRR